MAKKTSSPKPKKRVTAAFLRDVNALAKKHRIEGVLVAQVRGPVSTSGALAAAAGACPPGKKLTRVTFKDRFGKTVNTDICL